MLKYLILFIHAILFLNFVPATAQETKITGTVADINSGETLPGVNITANGKWLAVTNTKGVFEWIIKDSTTVFQCSFIGYETQNITLVPGQLQYEIKLSPASSQIDQVVVTAGRTPQELKRVSVSTDVIKPYLIEQRITTNMEHMMNQLPSVNVVDGQVNIRSGSGWTYGAGSRVMVLVDDVPIMTGDAGQVQWKFLPLENLSSVEVIKGAASVAYGSSALNGIINIRTATPTAKPKAGFQVFSGIYSQPARDSARWWNGVHLQKGFNGFYAKRFGQLDLTTAVNYLNDDGYRLGENDHRFKGSVRTNYHSKKNAGLSYGLDASFMRMQSSSFLLWESFPLGYTALDSQRTITNATIFSIDPHADFYTSSSIRHRFRSRILRNENNNETTGSSVNQDNRSWLIYAEYQAQFFLPRQLGNISAGIASNYTESDAPLYGGLHSSTNLAPFVQADLSLKKLSLSLGSRYEYFEMDRQKNDRLIFRAGANYELAKATFIRASYGEGYRFPSIAERYIQTSVGALNVFPNQDLKPETGWSAEAGIKQGFKTGNWQGYADVAYFYTEYDRMVEFNFGQWKATNPQNIFSSYGFKSFNIGKTRISGIDAAVNMQSKMGAFDVFVLAGYTYSNPVIVNPDYVFATDSANTPNKFSYRFTGIDSNTTTLKYRYAHLAKLDLMVKYKRWMIGTSLRYNSYMENIDNVFVKFPISFFVPGIDRGRQLNPDGDFVMDVRAGVEISSHLSVSLTINNLFNTEVMTRPADLRPTRLSVLQLSWKL